MGLIVAVAVVARTGRLCVPLISAWAGVIISCAFVSLAFGRFGLCRFLAPLLELTSQLTLALFITPLLALPLLFLLSSLLLFLCHLFLYSIDLAAVVAVNEAGHLGLFLVYSFDLGVQRLMVRVWKKEKKGELQVSYIREDTAFTAIRVMASHHTADDAKTCYS